MLHIGELPDCRGCEGSQGFAALYGRVDIFTFCGRFFYIVFLMSITCPESDLAPRSLLSVLSGVTLTDVLCESSLRNLKSCFPLLKEGSLGRRSFRFVYPTDPNDLVLFKENPSQSVLSDYSLWFQGVYRSFCPLTRIGLRADFLQDLFHTAIVKQNPSSVRPNLRLSSMIKRQTDLFESKSLYMLVCLTHLLKKSVTNVHEKGSQLSLVADRNCRVRNFAVPLFSLPSQYKALKDLLPVVKMYNNEGDLVNFDG